MARWDIEGIDGLIFSDGWRPGAGGAQPIVSPGTAASWRTRVSPTSPTSNGRERAAAAQAEWGRTSYRARADVLLGAAAALREIRAEVEHVLIRESGSLPGKASHEVDKAVDELVAAAGLVTMSQGDLLPVEDPATIGMARRIPVGVVGVISPWNAPLMLAIRSVAPAIALGNAVLLKPDVKTAFSGGAAIAEVFRRAGSPTACCTCCPEAPRPARPWCARRTPP